MKRYLLILLFLILSAGLAEAEPHYRPPYFTLGDGNDIVTNTLTGKNVNLESPDGNSRTTEQVTNNGVSLKTSCTDLIAIGDSNTKGTTGPSSINNRWSQLVFDALHCTGTLSVRAEDGNMISDMAEAQVYPVVPAMGQTWVIMSGNADVLRDGLGATARENYIRVQMANAIWAATKGSSLADMSAAGWTCDTATDNTRFGTLATKTLTGTNDDCRRTDVVGTALYVGLIANVNDPTKNGTTTVSIDGVDHAIDMTEFTTGKDGSGTTPFVPQTFRFRVEPGVHTVIITNSTSGKETEVAYIASNFGVPANAPTVVLNGAINIDDYTTGLPGWCDCGSDDDTLSYIELDRTIAEQLSADGLNVVFAGVNDGYNIATGGSGDLLHMNDTGHQQVARRVEEALSMDMRAGLRQPYSPIVKDLRTGEISPRDINDFFYIKTDSGTDDGAGEYTLDDFIDEPENKEAGQYLRWDGAKWIVTNADAGSGIAFGTDLPATCSTGAVFFDTDATPGQNIYGCVSANTWELQGDGGGVGGGPALRGQRLNLTALGASGTATTNTLGSPEYSFVQFDNTSSGCATFSTIIPINVDNPAEWNITLWLQSLGTETSDKTVVLDVSANAVNNDEEAPGTLTDLETNKVITIESDGNSDAFGNLTVVALSATDYDSTLTISPNDMLFVKICRQDTGDASDTLDESGKALLLLNAAIEFMSN